DDFSFLPFVHTQIAAMQSRRLATSIKKHANSGFREAEPNDRAGSRMRLSDAGFSELAQTNPIANFEDFADRRSPHGLFTRRTMRQPNHKQSWSSMQGRLWGRWSSYDRSLE